MDENLNEMASLHSAGAVVRHKSIFEDLPSFRNQVNPEPTYFKEWAGPYYREIGKIRGPWINKVIAVAPEITEEVVLKLLGDFNWRTRLVGAYFAYIKNYAHLIDIIGTHFLKSEVCCVGHIYALVLAGFNNAKTINYLEQYLSYYLKKPELYFDQEYAMGAMQILDKINKTSNAEIYTDNWQKLLNVWGKTEDKRIKSFFFKEQLEILLEIKTNSST